MGYSSFEKINKIKTPKGYELVSQTTAYDDTSTQLHLAVMIVLQAFRRGCVAFSHSILFSADSVTFL
ncbi:hypothetical protein BB560_000433 [Smittium megazygosporum]|uniref:Uncharacterized protein n=1 Tax=Smittium megazygosporum TaxID=133381 RepID=A0A2T9ZKE3_9FUNG|nr:hypothetical protein BB560_000433 [Smittium megazygosporum]